MASYISHYLAAKAVAHPRMRHLGDLLTLRPSDIEDDAAGIQIANAMRL